MNYYLLCQEKNPIVFYCFSLECQEFTEIKLQLSIVYLIDLIVYIRIYLMAHSM